MCIILIVFNIYCRKCKACCRKHGMQKDLHLQGSHLTHQKSMCLEITFHLTHSTDQYSAIVIASEIHWTANQIIICDRGGHHMKQNVFKWSIEDDYMYYNFPAHVKTRYECVVMVMQNYWQTFISIFIEVGEFKVSETEGIYRIAPAVTDCHCELPDRWSCGENWNSRWSSRRCQRSLPLQPVEPTRSGSPCLNKGCQIVT